MRRKLAALRLLLLSVAIILCQHCVEGASDGPDAQTRVKLVSLRPDVNFVESSGHLRIVNPFGDSENIELDLVRMDDEDWKSNFLQATHFLVTQTDRLGLFKVNFKNVLAPRGNAQKYAHDHFQPPNQSYHDLIMNYTSVYVSEANSSVLLITRLGAYLEVYGLLNEHIEITPLWRRNRSKPGLFPRNQDFVQPESPNELFIHNRTLLHRIVDFGQEFTRNFNTPELLNKIKKIHAKRRDLMMESFLQNHPILDVEFPPMHPELSIFVDNYAYENLGRNIDAVWRYFVIFFTRISLIFKQVDQPPIHLHLKNIFVATKPFRFQTVQPDFRSMKPETYKSYMNAMKGLREFGVYFNLEEHIFGNSDLTLVVTGQDLCLDSNVTWVNSCSYSTVRGQAFVGGACKKDLFQTRKMNVALVEDTGYFDGIHAAAHEIGHLLGAVHDGQWPLAGILGPGGRGCASQHGQLMSNGKQRPGSYKQYELSVCTQEQLQYYSQLPQAMCMYNRP